MVSVGRDYLAYSNARKLQTCSQNKVTRRPKLTNKVVELLNHGLMRPEAVKAFVNAYHRKFNELQNIVLLQAMQSKTILPQPRRSKMACIML